MEFEVSPGAPADFTLYVRKPDWSSHASIVSQSVVSGRVIDGYFPIRRRWYPGSKFTLKLDMKPELLESNARVVENNGRVAVQRGPLVYCLEELDQHAGTSLADVAIRAEKNSSAGFSEAFENDLLGGVLVLRHEGSASKQSAARSSLYFSADAPASSSSKVDLKFIPYYAWANRRPTPMQVWTPLQRS